MALPSVSALPRARLCPLQQPPLDDITVYNTATHCYLLATDSMQRDYYLLTCRKHSLEEATNYSASTGEAWAGSNNTASESDFDEHDGPNTSGTPSRPQQSLFCGLEDLHDYTTFAVYSPTEASSLVVALQREHAASMYVLNAVALIGAVRFTEGYYLVLVTQRRVVGHIGVHRLFEAAQVELVSLLLDSEWVAAQIQSQHQLRRDRGEMNSFSSFTVDGSGVADIHSCSHSNNKGHVFYRNQQPSLCRKTSSSATAAAAAYLFQRRSLEELYRQQFLSSLSRSSSFFYSHSYDLTNTLQRNMLAHGAEAREESNESRDVSPLLSDKLHQPRMQYVWNEYLLEPWQLSESTTEVNVDKRERSASTNTNGSTSRMFSPSLPSPPHPPLFSTPFVPQYPPSFARWRTFLIHGYITQRTVVVSRPTFHTLSLTLIARVSKASAGVRYLRRGVNSDGQVANHVEVEQIVSDESAWNHLFTDGAVSSYVQLRGSVPLRWYHPPTTLRLLPKPPIVIGPSDAEWSTTCLHFQELLQQYGGPILIHDLLRRKEHHTRESALGDAYRGAAEALIAAVTRAAAAAVSEDVDHTEAAHTGNDESNIFVDPWHSADVLQYESTDLRDLGPLAWNTMTAVAECHFDHVHCFVCQRQQQRQQQQEMADVDTRDSSFGISPSATTPLLPTCDYAFTEDDCPSVAVQIQCGVVRSNCLDCIDRTNLGQFFHGLHALGEQLTGLGLLDHAADLRDSPAVTELLLEMYLAMGDALATQYGGSAQVGAGVLHRGAGWDQLMGVKRLYNNVMGDRDKQEAIKLLLGRTQPHPRRHSRARNAAMQSPGQVLLPFAAQTPLFDTPPINPSITAATPRAAAAAAAMRSSPSSRCISSPSTASNVNNREMTPVPALSSTSFFSNLLHAASRWWGEATSASSVSSTAAAAASAAEALRAAQHAAAEAEAEPDYYEHVSSGPRLPPAGLLSTWWVQPLKEFAAWYAACGVDVMGSGRRRTTAAAQAMKPHDNAGDCNQQHQGKKGVAPATTSLSLPFQPLSVRYTARSTTATIAATSRPSAAAVLGDAFAQHLLDADNVAQQRWLFFVARCERQSCLAPSTQRRENTDGGGSSRALSIVPAASAAAVSSTAGVVAQGGMSSFGVDLNERFSRGGAITSSAAAAGLVSRPSASAWGIDDIGFAGMTGSANTGVTLRDGSFGTESAAAEAVSLLAPFSLTLTPSLLVEPWIVLRTTAYLLPIDVSSFTLMHRKSSNVSKLAEASSRTASLRLLYTWREENEGQTTLKRQKCLGFAPKEGSPNQRKPWPLDKSIALSAMRQLFGCVPPGVGAIASSILVKEEAEWDQQPWRCPEDPHNHKTFPRTVQNSVFARQEKALEQLAYRETMWIAEGCHHVPEKAAPQAQTSGTGVFQGGTLLLSMNEGHRGALRSTPFQHLRVTPHTAAPTVTNSSAMGDCVRDDQDFTAALMEEWCGGPEKWETEEIILSLQRLLYPAPLPSAALRVLRHSKLQPSISGVELLGVSASQGEAGKENLREYWRCRLSAVTEIEEGRKSSTPSQQPVPLRKKSTTPKVESAALDVAASLLCRLCCVLRGVADASHNGHISARLEGRGSRSPSPAIPSFPSINIRHGSMATVQRCPASFYKLASRSGTTSIGSSNSYGVSSKTPGEEKEEETLYVVAVAPLLENDSSDVPPAVRYALLSPDHPSLSEPMRRHWLLCRLLQPLFAACVLTPCLLHGLLQNLFSEVPLTRTSCACLASSLPSSHKPHRTRHHVRYTFAFSPQTQTQQQQHEYIQQQGHQLRHEQHIHSQLAAGAFMNASNSNNNSNNDGDDGGSKAENSLCDKVNVLQLKSGFSFSSPSLSSSTGAAASPSPSASSSASVHPLHIPATLEVKCCCTALELYHWCAQYRLRCHRAHVQEKLPYDSSYVLSAEENEQQHPAQLHPDCVSATVTTPPLRAESDKEAAEASWRLLWWAVENSLVVPVVRRREQATLEILADETSLFCVVEDVPRVALNVERRGRGEVWRHSRQQGSQNEEQESQLAQPFVRNGGSGAIYGVPFAAAFPVHRLIRRSALTDMMTLSETVANLGLTAATRLQEFFRDHLQHSWTRTSLKTPGACGVGNSMRSNGYGNGASVSVNAGATVVLFGGNVATAATGNSAAAGSGRSVGECASSPGDAAAGVDTVPVTPADVIASFSQLAAECLQSIQSVMVALQFVSLEALTDAHALHSYISFFINVYNAAYVAAWLTNVKELTSVAAAAAEKMKSATPVSATLPVRLSSAKPASALRSIDLFPLPTLCNTSIACFMHVYGVVIGHVFMSLADLKYGILGGNRAPPYRDTPLWFSSLNEATTAPAPSPRTRPQRQQHQPMNNASTYMGFQNASGSSTSWKWWSIVPLHLRVEIPEEARKTSLQQHPHLQAALDWWELCDVYAPKQALGGQQAGKQRGTRRSATGAESCTTSQTSRVQQRLSGKVTRTPSDAMADAPLQSPASRGPQPYSTSATSPRIKLSPAGDKTPPVTAQTPLYPTTSVLGTQRQRYRQLVDLWSTDVVRHLLFRVGLQLIDTYLPPPLFHLCDTAEGSGKGDSAAAGGDGMGSRNGGSGFHDGSNARSGQLDTHFRLDVDAERVPWYLRPILNTLPLIHPTLQSSKLGVVYGVAREHDGRAEGTLIPQINPDANGVLLQPCRMWSSPSYYVVGGDGMNGEEAVMHAFQVLQSLSGSYLGLHGYSSHGGSNSSGGGDYDNTSSPVVQHLCYPLRHEEVLAQLHATEVAFRSALRSTDPHLFAEAQLPSLTSPASSTVAQQQYPQKRPSSPRFKPVNNSNALLSPPSSTPSGSSITASCSATLHNAMKPLLYEWCRAMEEGTESISLLSKPGSQLRVLLKVVRLLEESYTSGEVVRHFQQAVRELD